MLLLALVLDAIQVHLKSGFTKVKKPGRHLGCLLQLEHLTDFSEIATALDPQKKTKYGKGTECFYERIREGTECFYEEKSLREKAGLPFLEIGDKLIENLNPVMHPPESLE